MRHADELTALRAAMHEFGNLRTGALHLPMILARTFIPGLPETKGSWQAVGGGRLRRDNPREKAWADAVGWAVKIELKGQRPARGFIRVSLEFSLPPPVGKKNRRDLDKLIRSVLDACTGILWEDDEQVVAVTATKQVAAPIGVYIDAAAVLTAGS